MYNCVTIYVRYWEYFWIQKDLSWAGTVKNQTLSLQFSSSD